MDFPRVKRSGEVSCTYLRVADREPQTVGAIEHLVAFAQESISEARTVIDAGSTMDIRIPCIASQGTPLVGLADWS